MATEAGISKVMSPHRVRHSSITTALDATGGNVRAVQQLSRHAKPEIVIRYDDNRKDLQGEVTGVLSGLLGEDLGWLVVRTIHESYSEHRLGQAIAYQDSGNSQIMATESWQFLQNLDKRGVMDNDFWLMKDLSIVIGLSAIAG